MISQLHRFHGYGSLKSVYKGGRTARGPLMNLKHADRPAGKRYRAAVVVSRKVHKSAVVRNRIRRRIYEVIRQADPVLTSGKDLVFTVFGEQAATMPAAKLQTLVEQLLKKARD
jgi:ribonuclease P protein component